MQQLEIEDVLHKELFGPLTQDKFEKTWTEEIGELDSEICVAFHSWKLPKHGRSNVYVMQSRMVAVENARGKWSAFATKSFCDEREYYARWANYCRGTWVERIPQVEGCYATRDLEGVRGKDRTLKRVNGRLIDVTCCSGKVEYGRISNWRGSWWSEPMPPLKGAV